MVFFGNQMEDDAVKSKRDDEIVDAYLLGAVFQTIAFDGGRLFVLQRHHRFQPRGALGGVKA